jgi:hypothetical protein
MIECKTGNNIKDLGEKSLSNCFKLDNFSIISDKEMHHNLHVTNVPYESSRGNSYGNCIKTEYIINECEVHLQNTAKTLSFSFESRIVDILGSNFWGM